MLLGWLIALMLSVQPSASSVQPDPGAWYGFRIGDPAPSGSLEGEKLGGYRSGLAVPAPWSNVVIGKDEQGTITAISLREECCGEIILDAPPHSKVPPAPVYVPPEQMMADGEALISEALRRLGPPSDRFDVGKGDDRHITMHWKYLTEFRGCQGIRATFDSPAHEPSGMLGNVLIEVSRDEIALAIVGKRDPTLRNVKEPTQGERADRQESCRRDEILRLWFNSPTWAEDNRRDCAREPEVCTVIDGAVFYHARGLRPKQMSCPPGNPPTCRCSTFVGGENDTPAKPSVTVVSCGGNSQALPPPSGAPK